MQQSLLLTWVDLGLAVVLLVSVIVGAVRGLVFEALSLAAWVVAYFCAPLLAPVLRDSVPALQGSGEGSQLGALVAAFVLILVLVSISARLLRALLHATPLKAVDRLLGSGFGLLRGMLLCLLAAHHVRHRWGHVPATRQPAHLRRAAAAAAPRPGRGRHRHDAGHQVLHAQGPRHGADVFRTRNMRACPARVGLGQVRYPTAGNAYSEEEAQPFYVNAPYGIVLVHNGNLTNAQALRKPSCSTSTAATSTPAATPRC
jgi:membrane protein required for colicin V production